MPRPVATAIVVLVAIVWAGNFAASVFVPGYQSDSALNFVFASIVGGALTLRPDANGTSALARLAGALKAPTPPPPPATPPAPPRPEEGTP
jgi:hypothetical protein